MTAGWAVRVPEWTRLGYVEVSRDAASGPAVEAVRRYLSERNPIVDRLLPNGTGGIRFFEDLDGKAGVAFLHEPAIGLSTTGVGWGWVEGTELHERAHLLDAFLPDEVSRLMASVPDAAAREYAATNAGEHFAEMAKAAWEIVAPPGPWCVEGTPAERLHDAEERIPGTAGFVAWYLRALSRHQVEEYDSLVDTAVTLSAPYRAEIDAVWRALDARRLPSGDFLPWPRVSSTVREYLERWRADAQTSDRWIDRMSGHLLVPSLLVVRMAGR